MLHNRRRWSVAAVGSSEELARYLTDHTWTSCQAFELGGYLFANDATCADGAQEYAVLRADGSESFTQIESITFSWCSYEQSLAYIGQILAGEFDGESYGHVHRDRFQRPEEHGVCPLCA